MKITLLSDDRIRYEPAPGPLTVDAPAPDADFSPYQMVASGLAACTYALLASWASHAKASHAELSVDDLVIEVSWAFADKPHRIANLDLSFSWPSLPASRLEAAKRAAALCPVHVSFEHPPTMTIEGTAAANDAAVSDAAATDTSAAAAPSTVSSPQPV